jgi:hypothetical protein
MSKATRTEHAGAKNGSGYWGRRAEAKKHAKKVRRRNSKMLSRLKSMIS